MTRYCPDDEIIAVPTAYLAGPMRGVQAFNFPLFHAAAKWLRSIGWAVFDPARADEVERGFPVDGCWPTGPRNAPAALSSTQWGKPMMGTDDELAMAGFDITAARHRDLAWITTEADRIVMLPLWATSSGASFERAVAVKCGLRVFAIVPPMDECDWILKEVTP